MAVAEVADRHPSERKISVVADHIGSFVGDSSPEPQACLDVVNHSFAFGAPIPAGKKLVVP